MSVSNRLFAIATLACFAMSVTATDAGAAQSPAALPLVYVLSTGGTIAGKGASSTNLSEYKGSTLLGSELIAAVPEIKQYARVEVEQVVNVSSPNMTPEVWRTLALRINALFAENPAIAGIVITHGTDTMIETARLLIGIPGKRIVLTGAMQPANFHDSDATFNVGMAIGVVITQPVAGVWITMSGQVFDPLKTRKNRERGVFENT